MKVVRDGWAFARRQAGRVRRGLLSARDRALHPRRRERAARLLRDMPRPASILIVCHGNICRSPFMEAVLRAALPDVHVSSAGFVGPGRGVPEHGLLLARKRGLDMASHRSRVISKELLGATDLAIVMDEQQVHALTRFGMRPNRIVIAGDLDPQVAEFRTIHDPWRQSLEVFESSYERLDRCAQALVRLLRPAGGG